jgi:type I site-specific restriction endonuclease
MPQAKTTQDTPTAQESAGNGDYVSALLDTAFETSQAVEDAQKARAAVREQLRAAVTMKTATAEQAELIEEMFPTRHKLTEAERAEQDAVRAEQAAAKALKRAQDAAAKAEAKRAKVGS